MFLFSANFVAEASERDPTANTSASGTDRKPCTNCFAMAPVPSIPHRNFLTTCARPSFCASQGRIHKPRCYTLCSAESNRGVTPALSWYVEKGYHYLEGVNRGVQEPWKNRREGQRDLPGVHDVRGKDVRGGLGR